MTQVVVAKQEMEGKNEKRIITKTMIALFC